MKAHQPIICCEGLWKSFDAKSVFENLSLTVHRGETLSIIGASGSGKSVLLKCLIGLMVPERGNIWFEDTNVCTLHEEALRAIRQKVAMVFQGAALFDSLTVAENIAYTLREHIPNMPEDEVAERVARNLEMVDLPGIEMLKPSDLSGGMKKRVGLARAIAIEPEVILYDEPTTGLDPISARNIEELIQSMNSRLHCTSVIVTHDMNSAFYISNRIAMLAKQHIVAIGTVDEVQNSFHPELRAFFDARKRQPN